MNKYYINCITITFSNLFGNAFINRALNDFVIKLILYFIICELLGIPEIRCQVLLRMRI